MITINFHKTNSLIGKAIRFQTGGSVNHISFEILGERFEANVGVGVRGDYDMDSIVVRVSFDKGDCEKALCFAKRQLGKKYDWMGILSFIWRIIPEHKGSWYCPELAMVVLMKYLGIDSSKYNQKQSPQSLLELCNILKSYENNK